MNENIFSPKGKIDQSTFIIYFILLTIVYFVVGFFGFPILAKHKIKIWIPNIILGFINLLVFFNYKKRIMDFSNNLAASVFWGLVVTLDHLFVPFAIMTKTPNSEVIFLFGIIFAFCIQPAIVGFLPSKNK